MRLTLVASLLLAFTVSAAPKKRGAPPPPPPAPAPVVEKAPPPPPAPAVLVPEQKKILRVALPDPTVTGPVPERALAAFSQAVPSEIRKLEGISAISAAEIRELVGMERTKQVMGCSEDAQAAECLAEMAGAVDADEMVSYELALVNETYALTWRRVNARTAKVVASETRRFDKRDGEELLSMVGTSMKAMFPERNLKAGRTWGVDPEAVRRLNPPPVPKWATFTSGGLALGAAAGGVAFGLLARESINEAQRLVDASAANGTEQSGSEVNGLQTKAQERAKIANILFGTAGGLAVATVVGALFTDWHGDREALTVMPAAGPGGAGISIGGGF
jgi:hypothetical protein